MQTLHRDNLPLGGFAGLKEHRLIKDSKVFGPGANTDGSWPGLGNFVYLADARFMPHGETHMHPHHEIDVISVMVEGRITHEGSMEHGRNLETNDVQIQRAGGEGFSHNEINPDDHWNRMIQIWVLPETSGQPADYRVYHPKSGETIRIYGDAENGTADFPAHTRIDVARLQPGQSIQVDSPFIAYITRGAGMANEETKNDGDLMRGEKLVFKASEETQLTVVAAGSLTRR